MRYVAEVLGVFALSLMLSIGCGEGGSAGSGGAGGTGGMPECEGPEDCNDGNECTDDACTDGVCSNTAVGDGTACGDGAGTCQAGSCAGTFACNEQGIRDAIAVSGGPHTFDCDGPTTAVTDAPINIDNNVILDGQGRLTVDGNDDHVVFSIAGPIVSVELRGFQVTRGARGGGTGSGVSNLGGTLMLTNCTVSGNSGGSGVGNWGGNVTLVGSTVSGNAGGLFAGGISNAAGELRLINSTVSGNTTDSDGGGIVSGSFYENHPTLTIINSTISGNQAAMGSGIVFGRTATITNSLVDGDCLGTATSNGYNIESPGNTCGFDPDGTDQINVAAEELNLDELADNGGPTMTHALEAGSVAIDQIPEADCQVSEDQRGLPRPVVIVGPESCDVGSFEVQPAP